MAHRRISIGTVRKGRRRIIHGACHISGKGYCAVMYGVWKITPLIMLHSHNTFRRHKVRPGTSFSHRFYRTMKIDHQFIFNHKFCHHLILPHRMLGIIFKEINFQSIHSPACPKRNQFFSFFSCIQALHRRPDPDLNILLMRIFTEILHPTVIPPTVQSHAFKTIRGSHIHIISGFEIKLSSIHILPPGPQSSSRFDPGKVFDYRRGI